MWGVGAVVDQVPGGGMLIVTATGTEAGSRAERDETPGDTPRGLAAYSDLSEDQAGVSPGLPASVTKEAAVVMGAPGVVTADTVLKSARAASLPRVTRA